MLQELVKQHLSSVLITGAVAAVSAYVLWGGDSKEWRKGSLRPSLENLGNTCFLNCVTQALSSVDGFKLWLESLLLIQLKEPTINAEEIPKNIKTRSPMISALYEIITTLRKPTDGSQSTSLLKVHKAMAEHGWESLFTQEDAYEAFQVLITSTEKEVKILKETESLSTKQLCGPVQGKFITSMECMECRCESSKKIEIFDNLTLHLSRQHNVSMMNMSFNSLHDLLNTYFANEKISGVECEKCTEKEGKESVKRDFIKHVKIAKAPSCLCIQINRTEWQSGVMVKNNEHVSFPIAALELSAFAYAAFLYSSGDSIVEEEPAVSRTVAGYEVVRSYNIKTKELPMVEGLVYSLKAVIVHYGTANAGHYATYRKLEGDRWLYASDDVVRFATVDEIERQQAYLLFYEKQIVPELLNTITPPDTPPVEQVDSASSSPLHPSDRLSPPTILRAETIV